MQTSNLASFHVPTHVNMTWTRPKILCYFLFLLSVFCNFFTIHHKKRNHFRSHLSTSFFLFNYLKTKFLPRRLFLVTKLASSCRSSTSFIGSKYISQKLYIGSWFQLQRVCLNKYLNAITMKSNSSKEAILRKDYAIGVLLQKREVSRRFANLELIERDKPKSNQY